MPITRTGKSSGDSCPDDQSEKPKREEDNDLANLIAHAVRSAVAAVMIEVNKSEPSDAKAVSIGIQVAGQLPPPPGGAFTGNGDTRTAAYFEFSVRSITTGLNSACQFFYLKRYIAIDVWTRMQIGQMADPRLSDYSILVEKMFFWLKQEYDTIAKKDALLRRWNEAKQEPHDGVDTYCMKLRQLSQERMLLGMPPTEFERLSKLRNGFYSDTRIQLWLSLQHSQTNYDSLEGMLLNYSANLPPQQNNFNSFGFAAPQVNLTERHAASRNLDQKTSFTTGCARCRDRSSLLHSVKHCTIERPTWWTNQTCGTCGRVHTDRNDCPYVERFDKRKCPRCQQSHSPAVCGLSHEKPCANNIRSWAPQPTSSTRTIPRSLTRLKITIKSTLLNLIAIVDSGTTDNLIDYETYLKIKEVMPKLHLRPVHQEIIVADGRSVNISGEIRIIAVFENGVETPLDILVVERLSQKFLLTEDYLRALGCIWVMTPTGDKFLLGDEARAFSHLIGQTNALQPHVGSDEKRKDCNCVQVIAADRALPINKESDFYSVNIPWSSSKRPNYNHEVATQRDHKEMSRLAPPEKQALDNVVQDLLKRKILKPTAKFDCRYFLPLRIVKAEGKSTPLRITVDAKHFNRFVDSGRNACKHMRATFLHWRQQQFFIATDLEKAFYAIHIGQSDSKFLSLIISGEYYQFARLPMGLSYSPKALETVLADIEDSGPTDDKTTDSAPIEAKTISKKIDEAMKLENITSIEDLPKLRQWVAPNNYKSSKFVDDLHYGGQTEMDCINSCIFGIQRLAKYGFYPKANKSFSNIHNIRWLQSNSGKMLGHNYDGEGDEITQQLNREQIPEVCTRSDAISLLSRFYDPYGLHIEVTMLLKDIQCEIFAHTDNWDSVVPAENMDSIRQFLELYGNKIYRTPRLIITSECIVFVDASARYWCVDIRDRNLTRIFASNGKLKPGTTIPRGELQAMYRGAVLMDKLKSELACHSIIYLSDSLITIQRLRRPALPQGLWESRRLETIRGIMKAQNAIGIHIETAYNLADQGTKQIQCQFSADQLLSYISQRRTSEDAKRYIEPVEKDEPEDKDVFYVNVATRSKLHEQRLAHEQDQIMNTLKDLLSSDSFRDRLKASQGLHKTREDPTTVVIQGVIHRITDVMVIDERSETLRQAIIPPEDSELEQEIISRAHNSCGHLDTARTVAVIRRNFYVKALRRKTYKYISDCPICIVNKTKRQWHAYASTVPWTRGLWRILGIDHAFLPVSQSNGESFQGYLSVTDYVSKFTVTIPSRTWTASEVVFGLRQTFGILGYPQIIMHDGATNFIAHEFQTFLNSHGIKSFQIAAYAAESAGFYERGHKTIKEMLRAKVIEQPVSSWPELLQEVTCQLNSIPYDVSAPELTPAMLNLGYEPRLPQSIGIPIDVDEYALPTADEIRRHRGENLNTYMAFWERRRSEIRQTLLKRGRPTKLEIGQEVMVYRPRRSALEPEWKYAGRVCNLDGNSSVIIRVPDGREITEHRVNVHPLSRPGV